MADFFALEYRRYRIEGYRMGIGAAERVKVFGTFGPSCSDYDTIHQMFLEGMDGMRLNLSHSSLWDSRAIIEDFHKAELSAGVRAELMIDMQGPELRIGALDKDIRLREGELCCLYPDDNSCFHSDFERLPIFIPVPAIVLKHLLSDSETDSEILLDDGKCLLKVISGKDFSKMFPGNGLLTLNTGNGLFAFARVVRGTVLSGRKSIKIVGQDLSGPVITEGDRKNLLAASEFGVTAVMQPFVRSGEDLVELKNALKECNAGFLKVFAKIENRTGIERLLDIASEADMLVIARGDLGNDMPLWELPTAQAKIARKLKELGKPFLVVTEMLSSMLNSPVPARADLSDVFRAVSEGAEAVMLTNETAVGKYPLEAISYLRKTCDSALDFMHS